MKIIGEILIFIVVFVIISFAKAVYINEIVNKEKLVKTVKEINAELPKMISREMRMDELELKDKHLIYKYTLVNFMKKNIPRMLLKRHLVSGMIKSKCSDEESIKMLKKNYQFEYSYHDKDGKFIDMFTIQKKDCGF